MTTHYDVLGVCPTATASEIKGAFKRLALTHHPDKNLGGSADAFKRIMDAYSVVGQVSSRSEYDRSLGVFPSSSFGGSTPSGRTPMYRPHGAGTQTSQPKRPFTAGAYRSAAGGFKPESSPGYQPFGGPGNNTSQGPTPPDRAGGFSFTSYYYDRMKQAASGFRTAAPPSRPSTASSARPPTYPSSYTSKGRRAAQDDDIPSNDEGSSDEEVAPNQHQTQREGYFDEPKHSTARPFSAGIHRFNNRYQAFRDAMKTSSSPAPPPSQQAPPQPQNLPKQTRPASPTPPMAQQQPPPSPPPQQPVEPSTTRFERVFQARPSTARARFTYSRPVPEPRPTPKPQPKEVPTSKSSVPRPEPPIPSSTTPTQPPPVSRPPVVPTQQPTRRPATATVRPEAQPPAANNQSESVSSRYDAYLSKILGQSKAAPQAPAAPAPSYQTEKALKVETPMKKEQATPKPTEVPSWHPVARSAPTVSNPPMAQTSPNISIPTTTPAPASLDDEESEIEARYARLLARLSGKGM